jgi:hypothetical protein
MPTSQGSEFLIWPDSGSVWLTRSRPVDPSWVEGDVRYSFGQWWTEWRKPAVPAFEIVACVGDKTATVYSQ